MTKVEESKQETFFPSRNWILTSIVALCRTIVVATSRMVAQYSSTITLRVSYYSSRLPLLCSLHREPAMGGNKIVLMADYGVGDYANSTWLLAVSAAHCVCHGGWQLSMKFSTPSKVNEITLGRLLYVFDTNP